MAESMPNSSDIPNFDTYPSTPSDQIIDYKGVERSSIEEPLWSSAPLNWALPRVELP